MPHKNPQEAKEYQRKYQLNYRQGIRKKDLLKTKKCLFCKNEFEPINAQQKFCNIKCKAKNRKYQQIPDIKFRIIKEGAKRKKIEFELNFDWYISHIWNKSCAYCGNKTINGIDRDDNEIGYTKANSLPCCWICNRMKSNYSIKDFLLHVKKITDYQSNKND